MSGGRGERGTFACARARILQIIWRAEFDVLHANYANGLSGFKGSEWERERERESGWLKGDAGTGTLRV